MAVRVTLECGHTSTLRMRTTPEGYTHDWEVFVRGIDNADIYQYIEKVVFLLHDTFRNPKRVLKEPPFIVKESGYAGFIIPIEIYLRNKDEPKKFQITYDLHLQPSGPPINNVIRHTETFRNPSDEFRKKLLKGGGMMVSSRDGSLEKNDSKASLIGKPKLNGSENKKHRTSESKTSNSFAELFGPPIKPAPVKISPESKKTSQSDKNVVAKPPAVIEKSDKPDKTVKPKEGLHRDSRRDKVDDKKDKKIRDSSKDQLKSKERSKKDLPSPGSKSHSSPGSKRPPSPVAAVKKSSTPPPPSAKHSLSPKSKEKEVKKSVTEKEKDTKDKDKAKSNSKSDAMTSDSSKSERKKEKKRHKDDKDKERKDKYKEADKVASSVKDANAKTSEKKPERTDKMEKPEKERSQEYKSSSRDGRRSPRPSKENENKPKDDRATKVERPDRSDKPEKVRDGKSEKERQKHKHKKRDKKDKRDSKDREKKEKRERSKEGGEKQNNAASSATSGNTLSVLLTEMPEKDSSDSAPSDDSAESKTVLKKDTEPAMSTTPVVELTKPLSPGISMDTKREKSDRGGRRDKSKRSEEKEGRKRKRNKEEMGEEISLAKRPKSTSPPLEPVSSSQSPVAMDIDVGVHNAEKDAKKDKDLKKDDRVDLMDPVASDKDVDAYAEQVAPDSTNSTDVEVNEPPIFSEDYVSQLKDLQHKIMTLQDNQELQRVVQLIAETGQYEITKKTFDFDLCALDRRTVQRLQQFFSAS